MEQNNELHEVTSKRRQAGCFIAPVLLLLVMILSPLGVLWYFEQQYEGRIYPGITLGGIAADGLSAAEASAALAQHNNRTLAIFEFHSKRWFAPRPEVGIQVNADEAAQQALRIGREGTLLDRFNSWQSRQPVVVSYSFDPDPLHRYLEQHRDEVSIAPVDAGIAITQGAANAIPARVGQELDAATTMQSAFASALKEEPIVVFTKPVTATLVDVSATVDQINGWLQQPLSLFMWWEGAMITRTVSPEERTDWVTFKREGINYSASIQASAIRNWAPTLNTELGETADVPLDRVTTMLKLALEQERSSVWFLTPRREVVHSIQRGDTYESIGDQYGIPVSRILAANPDLWSRGFAVGRPLTIPAQSDMMPVPINPTNQQHIEVDLTAQRLYAYDGARLELSATISSGIPKWRTLTGVFQVQEKVDEAFNKLARITMPNWLSIYDIGEPGNSLTNGIHALPVLGSGRRLWAGYLGEPVSFGCIVMGIEDSDWLYRWAQVGTPVIIYGETPPSTLNYDDLIEAQKETEKPPEP